MEIAYTYVALSAILSVLLWSPYVLSRAITWGIPHFLNGYPEGFPASVPEQPLWAARSQRAHLNLVETLPAFFGVVVAGGVLAPDATLTIGTWAMVFFYARVAHAVVYTLGIPYVRTPAYLVSWAAILVIGSQSVIG